MAADNGLSGEAIVHRKIFRLGVFCDTPHLRRGAFAFFRLPFRQFFPKSFRRVFCEKIFLPNVRCARQTANAGKAHGGNCLRIGKCRRICKSQTEGWAECAGIFLRAQFLREWGGAGVLSHICLVPLEKLLREAFGRRLQYAEIRAMEGNVLTVFMPSFGV